MAQPRFQLLHTVAPRLADVHAKKPDPRALHEGDPPPIRYVPRNIIDAPADHQACQYRAAAHEQANNDHVSSFYQHDAHERSHNQVIVLLGPDTTVRRIRAAL